MSTERIRESVIAGTWYPGSAARLRSEIRQYLDQVETRDIDGRLMGLIAPHAGYMYSGPVAAHAYKLLEGRRFHRVVVLAPSHRAYFSGASVYSLGGYRTPLGVVPLDEELVAALLAQPIDIDYVPQAHAQEHSLEIQLPFLQVVLGEFKLTPVVMGDQSESFCRGLAAALARVCRDKRVLLVASSDLSHYHSYDDARRLDARVLERVDAFDPEGLLTTLNRGDCEACGGGPMATMMLAARELGADRAQVLHYANSGDVTGDRRGVVGYMAAAVYAAGTGEEGEGAKRSRRVGVDLGLSEEEKKILKRLAYEAILAKIENRPQPEPERLTPRLQEPRGAFVTINNRGTLRGCIGSIVARAPLYQTVRDMAVQAAFGDPRFPPLGRDEVDEIDIEISVLTPLERIDDPGLIEIGKHGLFLRRGSYSGLLLPQVAMEHGWNREEFLRWTCRKAGLDESAWQDSRTEIYVFSADVF